MTTAAAASRRTRRTRTCSTHWTKLAGSDIDLRRLADGSAAVAHPGVLHPEHRRILVLLETGVDDLADEQRVRAGVGAGVERAVDVRDGLVEDGRARHAVVEREPVERARLGVDLDRLGELPDDGAVLAVDDVHGERASLGDELVREGVLLDADPEELGVEAQLRHPVARHAVPTVAGPAAHDVQAGRHGPQDTAPETVVLFGFGAGGERSHRSGAEWHRVRLSGGGNGRLRADVRRAPRPGRGPGA